VIKKASPFNFIQIENCSKNLKAIYLQYLDNHLSLMPSNDNRASSKSEFIMKIYVAQMLYISLKQSAFLLNGKNFREWSMQQLTFTKRSKKNICWPKHSIGIKNVAQILSTLFVLDTPLGQEQQPSWPLCWNRSTQRQSVFHSHLLEGF